MSPCRFAFKLANEMSLPSQFPVFGYNCCCRLTNHFLQSFFSLAMININVFNFSFLFWAWDSVKSEVF